MNASSLLQSQGWRGTGHTLHASDDSTGLARPLFVSRKDNTFGIGRKEHASNDQWWLNAFDQQLKGLDTSKKGEVVQTVTHGKLNTLAGGPGKYRGAAGLYTSFVKGETLGSTLMPDEDDSTDATGAKEEIKIEPLTETKAERRARREARRLRKAEKAARRAVDSQTEAKQEGRARKDGSKKSRKAKDGKLPRG